MDGSSFLELLVSMIFYVDGASLSERGSNGNASD